jgi:hypothetical protein
MKAGYPARHVLIRIAENSSSDVSLRVGKAGLAVSPAADGLVELELPEIPARCDTYLLYPLIPWRRHPVPDLFIMSGAQVIRRISLVRMHNEAEVSPMPIELPHE